MEENQTPFALLSGNELTALSIILQFYERHMWNTTLPSATRSQRSIEITAVIVKLLLLPRGNPAILTEHDIAYVQAGLRIFIAEVRRKIPQPEKHASLLASCQQLQTVFADMIPTKQGE